MLKKCNDAWLLDLHVPEKYLFFYQVWGEVTEPRTLSTYQYRLMNTLSILSELLDILSMAQQNIYAVGNELEACLGEARSIIAQDFVLKERCPKPLKVLQSALSQNPKDRNDYLTLTAQLEAFLQGMEHQYLGLLLECLEDRIAGGTDRDNRKKHLIWLTKQIVSVCLSQGKEISVLKKAHHVLQKETDSPEDEWQAFVNILRAGDERDFLVCIPMEPDRMIQKSNQGESRSNGRWMRFYGTLGSNTVKKGTEILRGFQIEENKVIRSDLKYYVLEARAGDIYSAARKVMARYAERMNVLSFYNVIYPWSLDHRKLAVVSNLEAGAAPKVDSVKVDQLYRLAEYREGAANLFEHTLSYLEQPADGASQEIQYRIRAAFNYANIGMGTSVQAERFINTWIALEVLCRTQMSRNIIDSILTVVPAALCLRYAYRLFRNFLEDCFRCLPMLEFPRDVIRPTDAKERSVTRLLAVFADDDLYQRMEAQCAINGLLLYRCHELRQMCEKRDLLFDKIMEHHQNVTWQLSRLYRMRNAIAHSAQIDGENLVKYNEHLNDYLYSFVAEIIHYVSDAEHRASSVDAICIAFQNQYRVFEMLAKDYKYKKKKGQGTADEDRLLKSVFASGVISIPMVMKADDEQLQTR